MGLQPLGDQWLRRIARATGLDVVWGSSNGGYVHNFTTADHRHGWFDLKEYRRDPSSEQVWGLVDGCTQLASCQRLFPEGAGAGSAT